MDELFNTSKTNWLELEADPAKTTNAAIEEHQKVMAQHFERAIAEARRLEDVKAKQMNQLAGLIGQGIKVAKSYQEWNDNKKLRKDYRDKSKPGKEVKPEKPDSKEEDKEKEIEKANNEALKQQNTEANAALNDDKNALDGKDLVNVLTPGPAQVLKENTGNSILFVDENLHTFMRRVENEPILLEGMPENEMPGSNGRWTIKQAEAFGGPEGDRIAEELRWHYRGVFLELPELKGTPKRILFNKIIPKMMEYDQKERAAIHAALRDASIKQHEERRRDNFRTCIIDGGGTSCITRHVYFNEGRADGTKDNAQGWKISLQDVRYLVDNDYITPEQVLSLREGLIKPRGGGKDVYMNEMKNLDVYDKQLFDIYEEAETKRSKEIAAKKKTSMISTNDEAITKLMQDKANGVRIDNEYIDNVLTQMEKKLKDEGIFITKEELKSMDNSIDKFDTYEEMQDEDITDWIDTMIDKDEPIDNWERLLVQIDDQALYKKYAKKLEDHQIRLSLVSKEDIKEFKSKILPEIDAYLQITQATKVKTPLKRNLIDNTLKIWKAKVKGAGDSIPHDKAKGIAFDEIQNEIAAATEKGIDLPGKYTQLQRTTIDVDAAKRNYNTSKYIDETPNAITDKKPWDVETPEVLQQAKDYLAGKAQPPQAYISLSNKFPDHTYHSLIETRVKVDPKEGEVSTADTIEVKSEESKLEGGQDLTKNSTNQKTLSVLNRNDIEKVLDIAKKTDDANSLIVGNMDSTLASPLEKLGFDRPLSELSVDEIRGLVADESFHGFSDAKFGVFGIRGNQLKTILERESIDGDRLFDEDLQNELAIHNIRYKANQANSLSTTDSSNTRLTNISRAEQEEFLQIMGILSGDKDSENVVNTVEYQFLNSPFNQLDVLLPAVKSEVIQKDPTKSTGTNWEGVGFPFVGIYKGMNERWKKSGETLKQRGEEVRQQRAEQEQKFPTK